jgi:hypothetical protein
MDAAGSHFREIVEPNAEEYLNRSNLGSVRHGFNAAISLAHLVEHFFEARKDAAGCCRVRAKSEDLRQDLYRICPDLELLVDVCNAAKHARLLVGKDKSPRPLAGAQDVAAIPQFANSALPANDALTPANAGADFKVVLVTFNDGRSPRPLHTAVANGLQMWRGMV